MTTPPPPTIIVEAGPTWAQVIVPAVIGVAALLIAAVIGARLGARWAKTQTLELHRTQRRQDALLDFLDWLSKVDMAMRRSLPTTDEQVHWSQAVGGLGSPMIREYPGVTWDRADEPKQQLYRWGDVVGTILDAEAAWRDHLQARVADTELDRRWFEIMDRGARMGVVGVAARGSDLESLHNEVVALMDEIRKLA